MKPLHGILTVISVITLAISVYLTKTGTANFKKPIAQAPETPEVLSETAPPVQPSSPTPSIVPTIKPSVTPSSTPKTQVTNFDISAFIYPGGKVIERSSTHLAIESSDSPQNITPWYKDQIQKYKFNAKSFASTNTNGNFLTKMAGAGADGEITIEIKKAAPDTITLIEVDLSK